jgi:hypothetical protein
MTAAAAVALALPTAAEPPGWPEAVARLAGERTRAEACARLVKRHGAPADIARAELTYGDGKADIDGVVSGLVVALSLPELTPALADLETRLARAVERRATLCATAAALLPASPATRGLGETLAGLASALVDPLRDAVSALWNARREDDALVRQTIRTQLEATRWPEFASLGA